ncbi:MAG: DUF4097 family beta strand repeat protein [Thermaceae bacterium]|nr:DUF4097 family beta strand repeat protein [Thermaceae bacterium]
MDERERIIRLVSEGKITPEEAALLLDALAEVETPSRLEIPLPPVPPISPIAPQNRGEDDISYLPNLRWLKVRLDSEDLGVYLDKDLQKPRIEGDVQVQEQGQDLVISSNYSSRRKGLTKFLGLNINWDFDYSSGSDPEIHLPEGWGLEVELASGNLEVNGLPFVRGNVASGDVELIDVRGVDLRVMSGDLEAELILSEGEHRLEVMSGDVQIRFRDSSVQVLGKLSSGELDGHGNFTQEKRKVSGTVGGGKARLLLNVMSGDLTLEDQNVRA